MHDETDVRAVRQVVRQLGPNFLHRLFGDGQFILAHISQQTFRNRPDRTRGFRRIWPRRSTSKSASDRFSMISRLMARRFAASGPRP